jgi:hypothetical protein
MALRNKRVAVLGAGLQGACIAMELARRGVSVDLYERNATLLAEASAHNEGKIHLGYVYSNDPTFATARLMAAGALRFEALLRRWIGEAVDALPVSSAFTYVVHRRSLIAAADFERHARAVAAFAAGLRSRRTSYFGRDPGKTPAKLCADELRAHYDPAAALCAYRTQEVGIDPERLAETVRVRLAAHPRIRCLTDRTVTAVAENGRELRVGSTGEGASDCRGYDFVVNTLWSDRLAIDAQLGLCPRRPWSFRFKYFIRAETRRASRLPSTTVVLGPFGDVVNYGNGALYLSWYPAGMVARATCVRPPRLPHRLEGARASALSAAILDGLASWAPAAGRLDLTKSELKGGWIFAWGDRDIDDPASELHRRCDVGVRRHGRYLSVDTGKLTVAPLFAERAVAMLAGD